MLSRLHVPLLKPEDVRPHLAEWNHWREDYSAQELAFSWANARNDFPTKVRELMQGTPEYKDATLVDAFFEREVKLRTRGKNSQTDLMVVVDVGEELAIIAVEGKLREPFSEVVRKWNNTSGRQARLESLCETLNLRWPEVGELRYQLFHRVASAVYEAHRYHAQHAMLLVHSFSPDHCSFKNFAAFANVIGTPIPAPGSCSEARMFENVSVRLAWVSDKPRSQESLVPLQMV